MFLTAYRGFERFFFPQVLTLYQGKMTTGRRSSPIPQIKCVGGSAQGQFNPEVPCLPEHYDYGTDYRYTAPVLYSFQLSF